TRAEKRCRPWLHRGMVGGGDEISTGSLFAFQRVRCSLTITTLSALSRSASGSMPQQVLRLAAIVQSVADESLLAEALLFPGASCFGASPERVREMLPRRRREMVKQLPPGTLWQRRLAELPELKRIDVAVPPVREDAGRRGAVTLTFRYVQWRHGSDGGIAYVPALQIEVLAEDERQLAELLGPQIAAALARRQSAAS